MEIEILFSQPAILFTTLHRSSIDLVTRSARSLDTSLQLTLALFLSTSVSLVHHSYISAVHFELVLCACHH
jgi:hypothetical protein